MEEQSEGLSWGVRQRLEFIEFRLFWEGGMNRSDLIKKFGVSVPQASKDLSQYQEFAPGNMEYDKSEKRYFASDSFVAKFLDTDPDRYLSQLRAIADCVVSPKETWLASTPNLDSMPIPHRHVNTNVLRGLLTAIRTGGALDVRYQSMNPNRQEAIWRGISPHAFVSDGFRWHIRAYCHIESKFKDFVLSRCLDYRNAGTAKATGSDDTRWQEFFEVKLKPNPKLSKSQRKVIAEDYCMENDEVKLSIRRALLYYFQKRLRLDVAEAMDNPQETPVVIANKAAFDKALTETKA